MARIAEKGLIAKKVGMTRMVDADGKMIPVTLLKVEDQKVTKILTEERDGYNGYQLGYFKKSEKNLTKADLTRLRKTDIDENFARFREIRTSGEKIEGVQLGAVIGAGFLDGIASLDVTGISKGRGFQGAVKRWGASIGRMTHGSRFHRRPGSLGQCTTPGRVYKNKHQPGHMGVDVKTIKNIRIVDLDTDNNVIAVKGSVPGHREGFVELRPTNKK